MINSVTLIGRLGQDPEARTSNGGVTLCNFSMVTDGRKKDGDAWVDDPQWHRVVCFGKTAEFVTQYGAKGRLVYVRGSYKSRNYQDKDGVTKTSWECVADEVKLLGPKTEAKPAGNAGGEPDSDLPF